MKAATCIIALCLLAVSSAAAESLWTEKGALFQDIRASKVGDIVTILVMESAQSTQKAGTDLSRDSGFNVGPGTGFLLNNIPGVGYSGKSSSTGEGTTSRTSNLITRMTATVTEVLPNGNLVIQGQREIQTNEEKQQVTLTGVIRPVDISPSNTVSSTNIADAKIVLSGKGPINDRQKEGIFTRIIRFLF